MAQIADDFFSVDRGLPWTAWQLLRQPGWLMRRYIEWRDPRVTKPLRYYLILTLLASASLWSLGGTPDYLEAFLEGYSGSSRLAPLAAPRSSLLGSVLAFLVKPEVVMLLVLVPALAAATRRTFGRCGINGAESLALAAYLVAQSAGLFAVAVAVGVLIPGDDGQRQMALQVLAVSIYPVLALRSYFRDLPHAAPLALLTFAIALGLSALAATAALLLHTVASRGA